MMDEGYHPKHVELYAENIIKLYIVASCWTIIDISRLLLTYKTTNCLMPSDSKGLTYYDSVVAVNSIMHN